MNAERDSRVCNDCYFFLVSGASSYYELNLPATGAAASNKNNNNNDNNNDDEEDDDDDIFNSHNNSYADIYNTNSNASLTDFTPPPLTKTTTGSKFGSFSIFAVSSTSIGNKDNSTTTNNSNNNKNKNICCHICSTEFSMFKYKQQCKNCFNYVCADCHRRKCLVPTLNKNKESQVCDSCYFATVGPTGVGANTAAGASPSSPSLRASRNPVPGLRVSQDSAMTSTIGHKSDPSLSPCSVPDEAHTKPIMSKAPVRPPPPPPPPMVKSLSGRASEVSEDIASLQEVTVKERLKLLKSQQAADAVAPPLVTHNSQRMGVSVLPSSVISPRSPPLTPHISRQNYDLVPEDVVDASFRTSHHNRPSDDRPSSDRPSSDRASSDRPSDDSNDVAARIMSRIERTASIAQDEASFTRGRGISMSLNQLPLPPKSAPPKLSDQKATPVLPAVPPPPRAAPPRPPPIRPIAPAQPIQVASAPVATPTKPPVAVEESDFDVDTPRSVRERLSLMKTQHSARSLDEAGDTPRSAGRVSPRLGVSVLPRDASWRSSNSPEPSVSSVHTPIENKPVPVVAPAVVTVTPDSSAILSPLAGSPRAVLPPRPAPPRPPPQPKVADKPVDKPVPLAPPPPRAPPPRPPAVKQIPTTTSPKISSAPYSLSTVNAPTSGVEQGVTGQSQNYISPPTSPASTLGPLPSKPTIPPPVPIASTAPTAPLKALPPRPPPPPPPSQSPRAKDTVTPPAPKPPTASTPTKSGPPQSSAPLQEPSRPVNASGDGGGGGDPKDWRSDSFQRVSSSNYNEGSDQDEEDDDDNKSVALYVNALSRVEKTVQEGNAPVRSMTKPLNNLPLPPKSAPKTAPSPTSPPQPSPQSPVKAGFGSSFSNLLRTSTGSHVPLSNLPPVPNKAVPKASFPPTGSLERSYSDDIFPAAHPLSPNTSDKQGGNLLRKSSVRDMALNQLPPSPKMPPPRHMPPTDARYSMAVNPYMTPDDDDASVMVSIHTYTHPIIHYKHSQL